MLPSTRRSPKGIDSIVQGPFAGTLSLGAFIGGAIVVPILTNPIAPRKPEILVTPEDHATALHPWVDGNTGLVTIAKRDARHWHEQRVPIKELAYAVRALAGEPASYLSQHRFRGPRRITHLWQLGALWSDLDYHKMPEWQGKDPRWVFEAALELLETARIPRPTFAVATGRGLALVWLHRAVPRGALPRWSACQRVLYQTLRPLGADRAALDAARVLRIVGSVHERSGQLVSAITPVGQTWDFDTLADEVLPLTRAELVDLRIQRATRRAKTPREADKPSRQAFSVASLWEGRLTDLQTLLNLRWWGELPPGQRDTWLFLAITAMSWLAEPQLLQREAWALAKQAGGWDEREASARLQAIFRRAQQAAKGEQIEWRGQSIDPRYRFRNETMIEWLGITPEEQRQMRVLISPEEARRRERERKQEQRRAAGTQPREDYLAQATAVDKRAQALALQAKGMATAAIAREIGVSRTRVQQYLKAGCKGSVALYGGETSGGTSGTG